MAKNFFLPILVLTSGYFFSLANEELDPFVLIESRSPKPFSESSPWVSMLSNDELQDRQIYNLADALRSVPGMTVVRAGQIGSQASLFSRGSQSDQVTVLYEGRKLNGGFSGTYNLGQLSLNGVSTVEVLHGSSSVPYGAEGIGGAVALRNEPSGRKGHWFLEGGTNDSISSEFVYGFDDSDWAGRLGSSIKSTNNEQPFSGFRTQATSFNLSKKMSDVLKFDFVGVGSKSDLNYPGNKKSPSYPVGDQHQDIHGFLLSPGMRLILGDWVASSFYSYSEDILIGKDSFANTTYDSKTDQLELQLNGALMDGVDLLVGGSFEKDRFLKTDNTSGLMEVRESPKTSGLFAVSNFSFGEDFSFSLGGRRDKFSDFENSTTWSTQVEHQATDTVALFFRYATSYSPPQANDLYGVWGNPNLNPEKARTWETGVKFTPYKTTDFRVTYYETESENLIEWSGFSTANVGVARSKGIESTVRSTFEGFTSRLSFSYLDAKNSVIGERLMRRPRISGSFNLEHSGERNILGIGLNWVHDVEDLDGASFSRIQGDDYTVFRIYAERKMIEEINFFGRIENLFDKSYEEVDGYPALGRAIYAGLRYSF